MFAEVDYGFHATDRSILQSQVNTENDSAAAMPPSGFDGGGLPRTMTSKAEVLIHETRMLADKIRDMVTTLAGAGATRHEIKARVKVFHSDWDAALISAAVDVLRDRDGIRIDKAKSGSDLSDSYALSSLLYLAGQRFEVKDKETSAEVALEQDLVVNVTEKLLEQGMSSVAIVRVLNVIQAAKDAIATNPQLTLSRAAYDSLRKDFLDTHAIASERGRKAWPVTGLTVANRLGGSWNKALESVNMTTSDVPVGFGAAQFPAKEYQAAIQDFKTYAAVDNTGSTYDDYIAWVEREKRENRTRPSGPSLRANFPSFNEAMRHDGSAQKLNRVTERRQRTESVSTDSSAPEAELIRAKEDEISRIEEELEARSEAGTLTNEEADALRQQSQLAEATIVRYKQEGQRWEQQKLQWVENDKQGKRQFRINLIMALAVGVGAAAAPIIVWFLQTFGPKA